MRKAAPYITLVIPGLCGPDSGTGFLESNTERFPALERLLSRSRRERRPVNSLDSSLCDHFGLQYPEGAGLPGAALTSLIDLPDHKPDADYMMRADPVHLRADQSALRLFDSRALAITQDEADALVLAFNEFYADKAWHLAAPCPQRWYLDLSEMPTITTVSTAVVAGQDIDMYLPQGRDAPAWHVLMNEVQMLFHQHPVNTRREDKGEPTINSLWFWGEGSLPGDNPRSDLQVATDYPLAMGLASYTGAPRYDVPAGFKDLPVSDEPAHTLVLLDELEAGVQYPGIERWLACLRRLEQRWFSPLLEALIDGRVASVEIDPCNGNNYRTTRQQQRHFWKRVRPLVTVCEDG